MYRSLMLIGLVCLSVTQAIGEISKVEVTAEEYVGANGAALITDDFITGHRTSVSEFQVGDDGIINFEVDIDEITFVDIVIGGAIGSFYAVPGVDYTINYPEIPFSKVKTLFSNEVGLEIRTNEKTELNAAISEYNSQFIEYFNDHFPDIAKSEYRGSSSFISSRRNSLESAGMINASTEDSAAISNTSYKDIIEEFRATMTTRLSAELRDPFFKNYFDYSLATLNMSAGQKFEEVYAEFLFEKPILLNNPEYCRLVHLFYGGYFQYEAMVRRDYEITRAVNIKQNVHEIDSVLMDHPGFDSAPLRTLAILINLHDIYGNDGWSKKGITNLLEDLKASSEHASFESIAENYLDIISVGSAGHKVENWVMTDYDGNKHRLSDFQGKFVYVGFYTAWCRTCLPEMEMIQKFYLKFRNEIEFVSVSLDELEEDFFDFVNVHQDMEWQFLYGNSEPKIREIFNLTTVPSFVLISPEGNLVWDYTPSPSEGAALRLGQISQKQKMRSGNRK